MSDIFYSLSTVCQYLTLYSLSTVCQYLTLYRLLVLCHYVHYCLLQSVHCLSLPHTVPSVGSVSLCLLLSSTVCSLSVNTSHCTLWPLFVSTSHCKLCPLSVSTSHSICSPSPHSQLPCCSNTLSCFIVTAVTNVTLNSVIVRATKGGSLFLADHYKWTLQELYCLKAN